MAKIEAGHYQFGIYHVRRIAGDHWRITVEDGKGFSFEPVIFSHLRGAKKFCTGE
jgi:hypothetical protein